jgi:hypothetical protein
VVPTSLKSKHRLLIWQSMLGEPAISFEWRSFLRPQNLFEDKAVVIGIAKMSGVLAQPLAVTSF